MRLSKNCIKRIVLTALFCLGTQVCFANYGLGDEGEEVLAIQKQLAVYSYEVGGIDGYFRPETEKAVREFQKLHQLPETGVVDEETYKLLMKKDMPPDRAGMDITIVRRILGTAVQHQGVPYVFGGTSPYGFDCSGFVRYCFASAGVQLPRMADEQYYASERVSRHNLKAGDMVFFTTYTSGVSHVGIYIGRGEFIHASSSRGVVIDNLSENYYASRYVGAGRVLP